MTDPIREALEKYGLLTWALRQKVPLDTSKAGELMSMFARFGITKEDVLAWHKEQKEKP